jgi:hypothetical protein
MGWLGVLGVLACAEARRAPEAGSHSRILVGVLDASTPSPMLLPFSDSGPRQWRPALDYYYYHHTAPITFIPPALLSPPIS